MASIEKRSENTYRITVSGGYDTDGIKIRKRKTVELDPKLTPKQAEKEIQRIATLFEDEVKNGTYVDGSKMTFAEFVDLWLTKYAEKELAPKTVARYKELLTLRIIPALGHNKLSKLQPTHLIDFYDNLSEEGIRLDTKYVDTGKLKDVMDSQKMNIKTLTKASGISDRTISNALNGLPINQKSAEGISKGLNAKLSLLFIQRGEPGKLSSRTVLQHHRLISAMLTTAVQWQLLFSSPADRVKAPKAEKKIIQHYDDEQTKALLLALNTEDIEHKTMVFLDIFSGLRIGELMGLNWSNIDFENNTIEVTKASQYVSGIGTFEKKPKNESSIRKISIPKDVMSLLKEYRSWWLQQKLKCGDLWQKSDRLFVTWDGRPMFTYSLTNWFPEFLERHNLPKITPHGLRHTMASLLNSEGMELSAISKRLGHARISTTSDIYMHVFKKADMVASDLLEKAFFSKDEPEKIKEK